MLLPVDKRPRPEAPHPVTSNFDFSEWDRPFPSNRLLACATVDGLRHNAYCIEREGPRVEIRELLRRRSKPGLPTLRNPHILKPAGLCSATQKWLHYADHQRLHYADRLQESR